MKTIMTWILYGISLCLIVYTVLLCIPQSMIPISFYMIHWIKQISAPYQFIICGITSLCIVGYCVWVIKKVNERKCVDVEKNTSYIEQVYVSEHHMQAEKDCILIQGKIHNAKKVSVSYVVVYIQFFNRKGVLIDADEYYVVGREEIPSSGIYEFFYRYYKNLNVVNYKISVIRYKEASYHRKKKVIVKD